MIFRIKTLVQKELQTLLRDPQSARLLIGLVFLQLILFPFAATMEVKNNTLAIFNQDGGGRSTELIQRFSNAAAFSEVRYVNSASEVEALIDAQEVLLAIRFPADFSRNLAAGRPSTLQALLDGRRSNSSQIAFSYVQQMVTGYLVEQGGPAGSVNSSKLEVRHWYNSNLNYKWFIVPTLIVFITTIGTLIVTALSVAREREQGTFEQLLVSPLTPGMIMVGKALPAVIVAFIQGTIILVGAVLFYRIPFQGSLFLLYGAMAAFVLSLIGCGLFISSLCRTQQQAFLGMFGFVVPSILLCGFAAPIENMPDWMQVIARADPLSHFLVIVQGVFLKDMGAADVGRKILPLLAIATVTLSAATVIFHRKVA
jgi:ABC-2 type transport system permease protein